ncbi:hypothetical protein [Kribbella sp. HUAS MG21]|uniref:Integral membrane protein n=1 Tax=Kribbella sp. HUAS MG21 TaxID=3160966 RepID=A0AAU7T799_9ACTN
MSALYRYLLTTVLLSQRYLPPTLIFLAAMAVGTTSDSGPLQSSYAFCVLAMLVCTTWLTVAIVNHEDPTQRKITLVMTGSSLRVLAITVAVVLTWCVPLLVIGLVYPIVTGKHVVTAGDLGVGAAAQLGAAMIGVAIGLLCSRLVIARIGIAMLTRGRRDPAGPATALELTDPPDHDRAVERPAGRRQRRTADPARRSVRDRADCRRLRDQGPCGPQGMIRTRRPTTDRVVQPSRG